MLAWLRLLENSGRDELPLSGSLENSNLCVLTPYGRGVHFKLPGDFC